MQKIRFQRDTYLDEGPLQLIGEALQHVDVITAEALDEALQTMADLDAISASLHALDDHTLASVRCVLNESIGLTLCQKQWNAINLDNIYVNNSQASQEWIVKDAQY